MLFNVVETTLAQSSTVERICQFEHIADIWHSNVGREQHLCFLFNDLHLESICVGHQQYSFLDRECLRV